MKTTCGPQKYSSIHTGVYTYTHTHARTHTQTRIYIRADLCSFLFDAGIDTFVAMVNVRSLVKLDRFPGFRACHAQRDLVIGQNRPTYVCQGQNGSLSRLPRLPLQKRPSYWAKQTYLYVKAKKKNGSLDWLSRLPRQKRPTYTVKQT